MRNCAFMRARIFLLLMPFCFGVLSTPLAAAAEFSNCEVYSNPDLLTLRILQKHGIDPTQISFEFRMHTKRYENSKQVDYVGGLTLLLNGEKLGNLSYDQRMGSELKVTSVFPLEGKEELFKGKGLGRLLYILSARLIYERTGIAMRSDYYQAISKEAKAVWLRLVQEDYVQYVGDQYSVYQFAPWTLNRSDELKSLVDFFKPRIQIESSEILIQQ